VGRSANKHLYNRDDDVKAKKYQAEAGFHQLKALWIQRKRYLAPIGGIGGSSNI
jgi:hypothetical protein